MARKKINSFAQEWKDRIKAGLDYRKKYSSFQQWEEYRKMYRGQWDSKILPVNRVFSYGRTMVPRVYFRAPRVCITATRPDLVWHAKVVEAIDNQLIRETGLKHTLKEACLDAYLTGIGPIKLGYDSEFGYLPEQAISEDGQTVTQVGRKEGERIEYNPFIKPGFPWALRVMPEDVVVPWGSANSTNLPWIAHYVLRPFEDVKQDQKYRNTEELKGTRTPDRGGEGRVEFRPREQRDKDVVYAELWEVRDFKTKQILVFCEDQLLLAEADILQVEGLPWEFVEFNPDPEYFWPISDVSILEPQQKELNEVRTQSSRHRAISLLKFLYKKGSIEPEELEKFFSGEVGPGVAVGGEESVMSAITALQPHIPTELWREAEIILRDMREALGFGANQLGEFRGGTPPTATESGIVEQAFDVRVDERKDIVADVLVNIIRKWNQFIFRFWTEDKVVQIVSPQGTPFWIKYTGDQLKGEYFLSIDPESGMPLNRVVKYQMAKDLFNLLGGDQLIDQVLLRKLLLQHYESIEPLASQLIMSGPEINPQLVSQIRQPSPMGLVGAGGSRTRPLELEEAGRKLG